MFGFLEMRIIIFLTAVVSLVTCICRVYVSKTPMVYAGFRRWTAAFIYGSSPNKLAERVQSVRASLSFFQD